MPASLRMLSGNTGKARIQLQIMSLNHETRILDVGAVGPTPLELWREIPIGELPISVTAVDPDSDAVAAAQRLGLEIDLRIVNGYELSDHFAEGTFDLVICTQVLEHVAEPARFLSQIAHVLRKDGRLWMTLDSAHFERGHHGDPLWKRVLRPVASRVAERYYDFGLRSSQLEQLFLDANLVLQEVMFCNLGPLKPIATSLEGSQRSSFIPAWLEFEMALHQAGFSAPELFRGIYVEASKRESAAPGSATRIQYAARRSHRDERKDKLAELVATSSLRTFLTLVRTLLTSPCMVARRMAKVHETGIASSNAKIVGSSLSRRDGLPRELFGDNCDPHREQHRFHLDPNPSIEDAATS